MPSKRQVAGRRLAVLGACAALAFVAGVVTGAGSEDAKPVAEVEPADEPELPRGGRRLLPEHRLVGLFGAPQDPALGALGIGTPTQAGARLSEVARWYEGNRPVLPVFELVATIAAADPGEDGLHRFHQPHSVIRDYLEAAREQRALLLLDIQPGRADFADEVDRLERWLREPDVGLALDPEWNVDAAEIPGDVIGSVDVTTVDAISAELAATVEKLNLPDKLFVIHQFTAEMITGDSEPAARPGLATVLNVDGFGDAANKIVKYRELRPPAGSPLHGGFKLFFEEDLGLMSPEDVLALQPKPDLIVYE